jgi:hypothetical protein
MRSTFLSILLVGLSGLLLAGCSREPRVELVTGMVKLDGEPLEGADVRFVPKEDLTLGEFGGRTGAEGRFSIKVGGPGMVARAGEYIVLVTKDQGIGVPGPPRSKEDFKKLMKATAPGISVGTLPERYASAGSSPFIVQINNGTTNLEPFLLASNP